MFKRYLFAGLFACVLNIGVVYADDIEAVIKDNTTSSGFSVKEETTNTTIARFRGDGNVGIAVTSPTEKLEVNGNIQISGTGNGLKFPDGSTQTTAATGESGGSVDGNSLDASDGSPADAVFVDSNGSVGIGTQNPDDLLHIASTNPVFILEDTDEALDKKKWVIKNIDQDLIFKTTNDAFTTASEKARITNEGNVGISTTEPVSLLDLGTDFSDPGTFPNKISLWNNGSNNYFGFGISNTDLDYFSQNNHRFHTEYDGTPGSEKMVITASGEVGIGVLAPTEKLEVAGNIKTNSQTLNSDMRFKKDIMPLNGALEKVNNLQGVTYNWRVDEFKDRNFSEKSNLGIIAQEVEKVVPEVVRTSSDGYKSVEYSKLVPLLIEGIKEQQKIISELSERLKIVESKL